MVTTIYPTSVIELGQKHRRSKYKYAQLPSLLDELMNAEMLLKEFTLFQKKVKHLIDISELSANIETRFRNAWLNYYGVDAQEQLKHYYRKDEVQWWLTEFSEQELL